VSAASEERRQLSLQKQSFSLVGYNSYFSISSRSVAASETNMSTNIERHSQLTEALHLLDFIVHQIENYGIATSLITQAIEMDSNQSSFFTI